MRSGGFYVPMDPRYPAERLAFLAEDSQARWVVVDGASAERVPAGPQRLRIEDLESGDEEIVAGPVAQTDDNLAYLIYTSGSTGRPKAVAIEHRSVVLLAHWARGMFGEDLKGVVAPTSITFDISIFELFAALCWGGTVILLRDALALPELRLPAGVEARTLSTVPSAAAELLRLGALPATLRTLSLGGEALPGTLTAGLYALGTVERVFNVYGPSEDTTYSTIELVPRDAVRPSLGRPVAGERAYVLDRWGARQPIGIPGDIHFSGEGLSRGYLGRPELTAERYLPDPFSGESGGRMYRTGDLGRLLPDGDLDFLGRLDDQVKVRGHRVELGEVESLLVAAPGVREAAVVAVADPAGGHRLVACVVPAESEEDGLGRLRRTLAERLPEPLVPTSWFELAELPRTPNGKLDRRGLTRWAAEQKGSAVASEAPQTPTERRLAEIFGEVLGIGEVGRDDSFFHLGGHSLLATRVVSRVREALGAELSLRALFEAPTVASLAERIAGSGGVLLPPIEPADRTGELPLAFAQERLWFLDQLEPGSPAYNLPGAVRLSGRLEPAALARAFGEVVRRHEALRTRFVMRGQQPAQIVEPAAAVPLPRIDLDGLPKTAREAEAGRLRREEALRPFDLGRAPLLRALLLRLAGGEWVCLLTQHHIVSDGWSVGVLIEEMSVLYAAFLAGEPSPLADLPVQYGDYAVWQRRWLEGDALAGEAAWWRAHLSGAPTVLELPTDHPRPVVAGGLGGRERLEIPRELRQGLEELGQREGATLYMTLLAGLSALLSRYADQPELLVGSPVAGRSRRELEGLIGFFVNTLALRVDLGGEPSFRELLGRAREETLAALAHQDLPFERLVEELAPERSLDRSPLFQVMLAVQERAPEPRLPGLTLRRLEVEGGTAKFDLSLELAPEGEILSGGIEYRLDLFEPATVRRLAGHLGTLLSAVAADATQPISALPLLSAPEREQLLAWRRSPGLWATAGTVHGLFEEQARLRPEAAALVAGERRMTYGELARRSGALAGSLRRLGVGPEVRVGLAAERSPELVVGILGILRAGSVLVPLDPAHPAERLALLLEDSGLAAVVAQGELAAKLPAGAPPVLHLEDVADGDGDEPAAVPAEALAYVIYTSGSTGRPKGVGVSHANMVPMLRWSRDAFALGEGRHVLQSLSYAFDFGLWEILSTVVSGAALHIPPVAETGDPEAFGRRVLSEGIDTVHATPSFFRAVAETGARLEGLRVLHLGGEALGRSLVERLALAVGGACTLYNGYGPTEVTVNSLLFEIGRPGALRGGERTPIGRPSAENAVSVVDRRGAAVPVGVPGELLVGGPGVARGYLGRPELTAEKFVPDAFPGRPGVRLYRTGDLVRWLADGTIEFLGRVDDQVKIRGFRIEPGEIEAALRGHAGVREAVVVARDLPGGTALVAYVVTDEEPDSLRDFLRGRLPAPLVPSAFVRLDELPLTPTGKVDRRALPEPDLAEAGEREMPRTPVEEILAAVFAETLGVGEVGRTDSFFHLGGHSLLATRVVSRVREALGVELPLRALFEAPTVAALAERIAGSRPSRLPGIERVERTLESPELPLSFAQERLWFLDQLEPGSPAYNLPGAVRLEGPLAPAVLARALSGIVRRHESLRTRFVAHGGEAAQVVDAALPVPLPVIDLAGLPVDAREGEARRLAREEAQRPFDLGCGPLLRATLLRLVAGSWICLLTQHHIVSDGASIAVLVGEMSALYAAFLAGEPSPLADPPVQYGDYAVWQRRWLAGEALAGELAWWRLHLDGAPTVLELPADHPRPAMASSRGGREQVALPSGLRAFSRREGATLYMALLAGFGLLLSRYADQPELLVGSPVAGRSRRELEPLIGFFVNTLVLRLRLAGEAADEPAFRELLGRAREETLAALAHEDLPFERLVEALAPERSLDRAPLFQVMLAVQETAPELRAAGLTLRRLELEVGAAKFDLSLEVAPEGDELAGWIEYRRDLFEPATVRRLAGHLGTLLAAAIENAGERISALPLLTAPERGQIAAWHRSPGVWAEQGTVQGLFEEQARRRPEAVALMAGDRRMTYGELARRSGALARSLRRLGVGPEVRVGLSAERSPELVVGILGILRAGGVLVPLDPAHPAERLALLLEDSGLAVMVTQSALAGRQPAGGPPVLLLEDVADGDWNETVEVPGDALAYVIYTSGSTGRPKGVGVSHANVVPMLRWSLSTFGLGEGRHILQSLSYAFDFGLWEILTTVVAGAALHIPPVAETGDPEAFARRVRAEGIDTVHTTPSFFRAVAETGVRLEGLRVLHLGGEALSRGLVERLAAAVGPGCTLYNGYGPTEATVNSLLFEIGRPGNLTGGERTPIGRPSAENAVYVVDRWGGTVPVGVPGELLVGGPGVARGYLGRPELTAERFVPDEAGHRLYRTGDRVRWLAEGTVEFLGRVDDQVKIRGFRIEPGEIAAALRRHPEVREAVVVARELPGGAALVAYVVSDVDPGALRDFLSDSLPAALVPSAFVRLDELPLTPTGKVDRRALPEPDLGIADEREAPRTPVEEILAAIFAEALAVAAVGRTDSFFHLGGHSLLAARVVSRVREALGVELPLRALFEAPTVAALAERVAKGGGALLPPIERTERGGELPLSFAQERLWFLDQLEPGSAAYNLPGAVRLEGRLAPAVLARTLSEIVRRHEALRTRFVAQGGLPAQVVAAPSPVPLPMVDLSALPAAEAEARRLAGEEAQRPFDLGRGPLLRTTLLRLGAASWICLLTQHHIISDGGSIAVLAGEISTLYAAFLAGGPSPLADPPVQYGDYAVWQRRWLTGEALAGELAWWREHLSGASTVLELPTDHPRPAVASSLGGRERLEIPADLRGLSRREGATLYMTLLAGFGLLLSRYADQPELLVGSPVAGRSRRELEGLIGFFVNTLVLRVRLTDGPTGEPTFRELLARAREETLAALAHQDLPFERLVEELAPERSLDRGPLFQVMLAVEETSPELRAAELTLRRLELEGETAKFDLTLEVAPAGEGLAGWIEYRRDLFEPATARRLAGHLGTLLAAAVATPGERAVGLPLLTAAERAQLALWDGETRHDHPRGALLHELFEEQARRTPAALAVAAGEERLTYAELERRSGRVAARLRALGVGPEVAVGVCLERTAGLVVTLLGILRAGGFYVPMDPRYPAARLAFLVEDSQARWVVVDDASAARVPAGPERLRIDDLESGEEFTASRAPQTDGSLAYLIYTSGSTGRPKAVAIEHRSVVLLAHWARGMFGEDLKGVVAPTSITFDISIFELFAALSWGGTVILVRDALALAETGLPAGVEARTLSTVPSAAAELLRLGALPPTLRTLSLGGEALPGTLTAGLYGLGTVERVFNVYGPSEDTTYSTIELVPRDAARPSLGFPLSGERAYVLDRWGARQPVGIPGDIHFSGEGLSRGYLGRPELTAERYLPDPFSGESGGRMYRTGDLGRRLPDGDLDFLGRLDDQVKVRGHRVELGEIESLLVAISGVREAAVVAVADPVGGYRLVACVVPAEIEEDGLGRLRRTLAERLPAPLVPSSWWQLAELPRTPNGKLDRRELTRWAAEREGRGRVAPAAAAPRTPTEEILATIFGDALGIAEVGRTDSFFHLGGHSLLATRVVSRVRDTLKVELPLRTLFEAPTVAALAARIEALSRAGHGPRLAAVGRREGAAGPPLSFAQQRLWFLDRLHPGSALYNLPLACRLLGALDVGALAATLGEIVRRHEALRTRFVEGEEGPVQVVAPAAPFVLPGVDLRGLPEPARRREAACLTAAEAARPFDLAGGPVLRALLVRLGEDEWVLALTMHHIVSDAGSMEVMLREIEAIYGAAAQGLPSPLPELSLQYADFAVWQRHWLRGEELESQLSYWRERLAGAPPLMELPTDRPRPAVQTEAGASEPFHLGAEAAGRLRTLSRHSGAPLFMTGLAGFLALLRRYTGQTDLLVGTPAANRGRLELEGMIGFFVNLLVLRTDAGGDPGFADLLGRVRETALGAYAHEDLPFERLIEELAPERNLSHSPLFQVMFVLHPKDTAARSRLAELEIEPLVPAASVAKYDLTVSLTDGGAGLAGDVEFNTDLFDAATAGRIGRHLETLLAGAALHPEARLSDLPMLSAPERDELLLEWNDSAREIPWTPLVHELAAAAAREHPDALAVAAGDRRLSQRELHARSNRLAHHLRSMGVGPDVVVGICTEVSPERVVGILAVLKAGGAYASFDPAYPPERLALAMADARVPLILTEERFRDRVPASVPVLCLDGDPDPWVGDESLPPAVAVDPENLAYVVFTSGSMGRPKGVAVPHRGLSNLVCWYREVSGITAADRGTQVSSPAFDSSILELWPFLVAGAGSCIPDEETRLSAARMLRWWAEEGITLADLPTPLADAVLDEAIPDGLPLRLRLLSTGGDRLHHAPRPEAPFRLLNTYGPAEASVVATMAFVPPADLSARAAAVPHAPAIGRATTNTRVYALDADQRLVPVGVAGELHISGAGLARGYLWQPGLTAERFLPDPFAGEPGARMYRTGDRARWLADGSLHFLGRTDQQVKIRGMRVELGEIEAFLDHYPGVHEAVVLAPAGRLVAYLVAAGEDAPAASGLRDFLASRLPGYMVPRDWVFLDALPLTPNGKVDRRALAAIAVAVPRETYLAPRTSLEETLAVVWTELLGSDPAAPIGVRDDFFHLGGHSLLAIQVASRLRRLLGIELEIRTLFEAPTIEGLARRIEARWASQERAETATAIPPLLPVEPRDRDARLPLSFAQERLWFLDQLDPGSPAYNLPGGLRVTGALEPAVLARALAEIVRRHEALRTRFAAGEGGPVQIVRAATSLPLPAVDLRALPDAAREEEARRLARDETRRSFDLADPDGGPLLRAMLLRLAAEDWICLLTQHHIGSDGWSAGLLGAELSALYGAFGSGRPSPLPAPPLQYGDYALWQRRWLTGDALAGELAWWRRHLSGAPTVLELPTDHPRPAVASPRGGREPLALPRELRQELEQLGRSAGTTLFMTMLAGFALLLSRQADQPELLVGTPVAGRSRRELEGLIGFFVNTLALRVSLAGEATDRPAGGPSFRALLGRAREETLAALAHQDLPFERLVVELAPERDLDRNPLFQVMLTVQEAAPEMTAPGLTFRRVEVEGGTAKFDLSLEIWPEGDGLGGGIEYRRDLFEAATIRRLADHLETLLAAAAADAGAPVTALPLLRAAERAEILAWRRSPGSWSAPGTAQDLFTEQVRLHPEAVALVAGDRRWSYGELARRSGALARALRRLGVGPEVRVGLAAERSPELVAGILGILRAGGTLVPLDPSHPPERLALLLEDSGLSVVVTQSALAPRLPAGAPPVVVLEEVAADGGYDGSDAEIEVPAAALAYVIYTSGSTGRPKGVGISHASLVPMLRWSRATFGLEVGRRVLQSLSYAFDFGLWEILSTVVSGAALHIPPVAETGDPEAFARRAVEEEIDTVHATPSFFRAVAETGGRLERLRVLHLGGEALSRGLVERLAAAVGDGCTLYNGYGPTEATVNSLLFAIGRPGDLAGGERTPIGRPSAENAVYVVDRWGGTVPVGVAGELQVGGPGVARGYLGRPELTAEKFVPDPAGGEPGARLYRSGDLVRWRPDGTIEFLGRVDDQVKIRGFRVEPGEIAAALRRHPGVREAVVVARELPGGPALVAYVVAAAGDADPAGLRTEWREYLRASLPAALVPAAFVRLDALPLSPTGKVDRRALPEPRFDGAEADEEREAPRTPIEEIVAGIFAEVLGIGAVARSDSFFHLGGHSLLATRVVARVRDALGVELPLRSLFEAPTVVSLAERVEGTLRVGLALLPPIERADRGGELPLTFAQERIWTFEQLAPGGLFHNLPGALRLAGRLEPARLARGLEEVVRRHESLRTRFAAGPEGPVQIVQPAGALALPEIDLRALPAAELEAETDRLAREEARRPFDLGGGPLLRALLVRRAGEDWLCLLTWHALAADRGSAGVLARELAALYGALLEGTPPPAEPPLQAGDFAVWQRRWLAGEALAGDLIWWWEHLSGAPTVLELPTDRPRPAAANGLGGRERVAIPAELRRGLERLGRREDATLQMTVVAGFAALLARAAGQTELLVGSPVTGRSRRELDGVIGPFANSLALRVSLAGEPAFRELLARVRDETLATLAHQELPFECLVEALAPEPDLDRAPLFQVAVALREAPAESRAPGLTLRPVELVAGAPRLDLSLELTAEGEGLAGWIEYRRDLFDAATARRLAADLEALLRGAVEDGQL
ncbi:MAG TPA: non-ribosomal peptide synthase/polyketide synthase [Thermoanaerobaculia bacterium]|nr:non-ribosomal peptide synthase/polyketide synthase [Thermoanaerobaculia bacterium]